MAALKQLLAAFALAASAPASAEGVADWRPLIDAASARFGMPVAWIERVMRAESGGRTTLAGKPIVSRAGAMGLMQLMPATWAEMRVAYRLGSDPFEPRDNITAGVAYLRRMYDRFGYPGLFAAYNAGPARYADYLAGRRGLPGETRAYLATVAGTDGRAAGVAAEASVRPTPPALFLVRRTDQAPPRSISPEVQAELFAIRIDR